MATRRRLINIIKESTQNIPDNKRFLADVMSAIERINREEAHTPSKTYKPSSMKCIRNMYYQRVGAPIDVPKTGYEAVGMPKVGTARHEHIQQVLERMKEFGYPWEYVDVADYIKECELRGIDFGALSVVGKCGAETKLYNDDYHVSFMCDGIIRDTLTKEYYLFEFKNQMSRKFYSVAESQKIDAEHHNQVCAYCMLLNLEKALVLYESRDTCTLECPEIYRISELDKKAIRDKLIDAEYYASRSILPPKTSNEKDCRWCNYRGLCRKDGNI